MSLGGLLGQCDAFGVLVGRALWLHGAALVHFCSLDWMNGVESYYPTFGVVTQAPLARLGARGRLGHRHPRHLAL
jgi:hypothetical protein